MNRKCLTIQVGQFVRFVHDDLGIGLVSSITGSGDVEVVFRGGDIRVVGHPSCFKGLN